MIQFPPYMVQFYVGPSFPLDFFRPSANVGDLNRRPRTILRVESQVGANFAPCFFFWKKIQ